MQREPISFYGLHKAVAEDYARLYKKLYGTDIVGLRFFNVFGPRQDPNSEYAAVIPLFIKLLKEGKTPTINGDGTTTRDFTPVENIIDAIILAATSKENIGGEIYNVATGKEISLNELVDTINTYLGTSIEAKHGPERIGDIKRSVASIEKIRKELGWEVKKSFEEGIREVVKEK